MFNSVIINSLYTQRRKIHVSLIGICEEVFDSLLLNCTYPGTCPG